jgi:hypothetical protein
MASIASIFFSPFIRQKWLVLLKKKILTNQSKRTHDSLKKWEAGGDQTFILLTN